MILRVENVDAYYGDSQILRDVSLNIREGEIVSLLGRNGVGKTTTLKTIMGLVPPRKGNIYFRGELISGKKPFEIAMAGIGYVPEDRGIFPTLTVQENLLLGKKRNDNSGDGEKWNIGKCYEYFPSLEKRKNTKGGVLSGGEKQMLAIARALMGNPDLLLLDEPTEGLAPLIVENVKNIIREIQREGVTILLVEQKLKIALDLADRIYVMSKGTIVWEGIPGELIKDEGVRKKYLEV